MLRKAPNKDRAQPGIQPSPGRAHRVLVVDDEEMILQVLRTHLELHGCEVRSALAAESATGVIDGWEPDVAILDIILPGRSGLDLLAELRQIHPDTEVMVMTGSESAESALRAVRQGAAEYLSKPLLLDKVWSGVQRAVEKRSLARKNRALQQEQERRSRELSTSVTLMDDGEICDERDLLSGVLDDFVRILTRELDVERASVMLVDEKSGEMKIAASHGIVEVDPGQIRVLPRQGVSGFVAETGEPVLVKRAGADDRFSDPKKPDLSDSFLSVPIALEIPVPSPRQVLGVVNVTNRRSGESLDERDLAYLRVLTAQLAAAIDGARRSQKLQRAYRSLKATQDQLVFSERIQAVGQMAAGVVHDVNNALSVILARAEFMAAQFKQPEPNLPALAQDLQTIIKTCLNGAETVKRIQNYTRTRQADRPSAVRLNAVVRDAVELARPKWQGEIGATGRQIELVLELGEVPPIRGNVNELTQVVNNLIFNAAEAMPEGGRLTLRTSATDREVRLEVQDNGCGMNAATLQRLFQPFFTTKEDGQGLGTSIIYGIVTRHEGRIEVESDVGQGAKFVVTLPLSEEPLDDIPSVEDADDESAGSARILLVDDDEGVRETYAEALRIGGHDVVTTESAVEALNLCSAGAFDLVITDLSMTEMSGLELATAIKSGDPSLPVILFSGWALEQTESRALEAGIDLALVKPCRVDELFEAVRKTARVPQRLGG
jgi:signal transduction histidine kinase/DNA-binding response OmpR family regulator